MPGMWYPQILPDKRMVTGHEKSLPNPRSMSVNH